MVSLPHPVQYQGSKRNLASDILKFLPETIDRLVEPFAGTAAISIAASSKEISQNFWLNDLNQPLVELIRAIVETPEEIATAYTDIWNEQHSDSIGHYYQVREQFNKTNEPQLFLYLLARCVKGAVRYNSEGFFNQSPDKRRKGTQPDKMRKNIEGVSQLLKNKCKFTCWDYKDVLAEVRQSDFVYIDPPYQGVCGDRDSRYFAGISFNDFVLSLEDLNQKEVAFAVSYDGKRGNKTFGNSLPEELGLKKIEIKVGRSSQATLLGRDEVTIESLYLSPSLLRDRISGIESYISRTHKQLTLLDKHEQFSAATQ
ncbi:DNA adenine methylase [Chroococcidiopsis thermalis]|jgi:DNA adenine methylase|uniref:Site-specific DNA-methyltransferase (adenine-specific) n=1 Tax=Chroococcidiopsis thermalis (strain PCC 7203) TaxID=251229 RepID=K9U185_CHRTP|nr:DNA adenine methylase [Chroococcidiopsis thermalis]AFY88201.1 DNA adenine methylase [Chroococcidiopsis thermalis PCC 7203]PSB41883.1 DNA adenine methylase [Cyanosarcina cf. burmensis CCALA 770]